MSEKKTGHSSRLRRQDTYSISSNSNNKYRIEMGLSATLGSDLCVVLLGGLVAVLGYPHMGSFSRMGPLGKLGLSVGHGS